MTAAGGLDAQGEAGITAVESNAKGFKKELQDCEAGMAMVQQPAQNGSTANAEDSGMQETPETAGVLSGAVGIDCIYEGLEMPTNPSDTAPATDEAVSPPVFAIPTEGAEQEGDTAQGQQAGGMSETNARMQVTTSGAIPEKTQDEILEAVGAYLDEDTGGQSTGVQTRGAAQTAAEPKQTAPSGPAAAVPKPQPTAAEPEQADALPGSKPAQAASGGASAAGSRAEEGAAKQQDGMPGDAQSRAETGLAQKAAVPDTEGKDAGAAAAKTDSTMPASDKRETASQASMPDSAKDAQPVVQSADIRSNAIAAADTAKTQASETKAAESRYAKDNVLRIVDKVSTHSSDGKYDFDVELKPDFLGKVRIRLTMEDGSIRMQIKTDDASVKSMLSGQTSSLQDALKEKGITLSSVDVTYESQASLSGDRQPFEQNGNSGRKGGMYFVQAEAADLEPAAEPYSRYLGNSSVEFLA